MAFRSGRQKPQGQSDSIWKQSFRAMHTARLQDGRTLGVMLTQALSSGLQLSFVIGGLVVFFSVVMEVLASAGVMSFIYTGVQTVLQGAGIPSVLAEAVVNGFFEVTLGAKEAGSAIGIPPMYKAAIAAGCSRGQGCPFMRKSSACFTARRFATRRSYSRGSCTACWRPPWSCSSGSRWPPFPRRSSRPLTPP